MPTVVPLPAMTSFGKKEILHIAKLAHLDIAEHEIDDRLSEFNNVLEMIGQLTELDLKDAPALGEVHADLKKCCLKIQPQKTLSDWKFRSVLCLTNPFVKFSERVKLCYLSILECGSC